MTKVVALSGGVGGARFADGVAAVLAARGGDELTVVVNTGDDFEHWGLHIAPDVDTVMYTLSGLAHEARGWGLAEESFATLEQVKRLGGDGWFALGDRDLATHILRTQALAHGERLGVVTERLCRAAGVPARVLPMSDGRCRTMIDTAEHGTLSFQDWFVRHRTAPPPLRVWFEGAPTVAPGVLEAIEAADVVLLGPSNPYVSIDPILTLGGVREALSHRPVIAVSPILRGEAVKGPLAAMIPLLGGGAAASAAAVARHYGRLLCGFVVERGDEAGIDGPAVLATSILMRDRADRRRLAVEVLDFAARLAVSSVIWALVPVNDLHAAKSRLGGVLDDDGREKLARALCNHVLRVLCASPAIDGVLVLTPSAEVAKLARARGAEVLLDPPGERQRLGVLVDGALAELVRRGATGAIVFMSDLPRLAAADVEALVHGLDAADRVIAPDRHELGTNALALRLGAAGAAAALPSTSFGHADSFVRHTTAAAAAGHAVEILRSPSLALDVDLPEDLQLLQPSPPRRGGTGNPVRA